MCCANGDCQMKIFGWSNGEACIQTGPLSLVVERVAGGGGPVSDLAPSVRPTVLAAVLLLGNAGQRLQRLRLLHSRRGPPPLRL